VNLPKLAIDAVHRVALGLDALIPNHIHPIPRWNKHEKKYDLDLSIGYVGKDYCRRALAVEPPLDVIYELVYVYDTDVFRPYPRSKDNPIESYDFEITQPFDRGQVVGGFGYIIHEQPEKNRLVIVTRDDFNRARDAAATKRVWDSDTRAMMYKTLVHRVTEKIPLDPRKVNAASYAYVQAQEAEQELARELDERANREPLDVGFKVDDEEPPAEVAEPANGDQAPEQPAQAAPAKGQAAQEELPLTGTDGPVKRGRRRPPY